MDSTWLRPVMPTTTANPGERVEKCVPLQIQKRVDAAIRNTYGNTSRSVASTRASDAVRHGHRRSHPPHAIRTSDRVGTRLKRLDPTCCLARANLCAQICKRWHGCCTEHVEPRSLALASGQLMLLGSTPKVGGCHVCSSLVAQPLVLWGWLNLPSSHHAQSGVACMAPDLHARIGWEDIQGK